MEVLKITVRSYVNRKGERIVVTPEHIETAIKIKEELQKLSPTRRCSWTRHKNMMQQEGFTDSDTNENYRCLIKRCQKELGVLPSQTTHAELVSDGKLQAIKDEIGSLNSTKLDLQEQARRTRKLIRDTNKGVIFTEEVARALQSTTLVKPNNPVVLPNWETDEDNSMIVCLSDIHYGAHVDISENYYDTEAVRYLLEEYARKVVASIKRFHVTSVDIVNLGDIVEHAYMRNQNLFDSEETLSEQIVNVTRLIIEFIQYIRDNVELVTYRAIAGNHDRMQGDKNNNLNNDHAVRVSNSIIKMWIELAGSDVRFIDTDDYFTDLDLRGFHFAFVHGDRNSIKKSTTLAELGETHDKHYDAVISGHIHHNYMVEVGNNRYQVAFGSVKGMDDYSVKLGAKSSRSQGIVLVNDSNFEIKTIGL